MKDHHASTVGGSDMMKQVAMRSSAIHQTGSAVDKGEEAEAVAEQTEEAGTTVGAGVEQAVSLCTRFWPTVKT